MSGLQDKNYRFDFLIEGVVLMVLEHRVGHLFGQSMYSLSHFRSHIIALKAIVTTCHVIPLIPFNV